MVRFSIFAVSFFSIVGLVLLAAGCGSGDGDGGTPEASINGPKDGSQDDAVEDSTSLKPVVVRASSSSGISPVRAKPPADYYPEVVIETNHGKIVLQLDPQKAPQTVDNFLTHYVNTEFYTETVFHYVDEGIIVGGGYTSDLQPKEVGAQIFNEAHNGLKNVRGTIAMARHPDARHSATCQFFINLIDNPSLDHTDAETDEGYGYCVFGKVIEGMDVVDRIAKLEVEERDGFPNTPVEPVVIESVRQIK